MNLVSESYVTVCIEYLISVFFVNLRLEIGFDNIDLLFKMYL